MSGKIMDRQQFGYLYHARQLPIVAMEDGK